jgi:hypothetical protein
VSASDPTIIDDLFKFRRFRLNVLSFLRLPLDTHEEALRRAMGTSSARLLTDYLRRAEQVRQSVVARVDGLNEGASPRAAPKSNVITQRIHRRPVTRRSSAAATPA